MAYIEMIIDSIRLAKYRGEWVIMLREKDGHRYLPVYVNKDSAFILGKVLEGESPDQIMDEDIRHLLEAGDDITLAIDSIDNGVFSAECIVGWQGKVAGVKCSIGKVLAICAKTSGRILAEEHVLEKAGIAAKA